MAEKHRVLSAAGEQPRASSMAMAEATMPMIPRVEAKGNHQRAAFIDQTRQLETFTRVLGKALGQLTSGKGTSEDLKTDAKEYQIAREQPSESPPSPHALYTRFRNEFPSTAALFERLIPPSERTDVDTPTAYERLQMIIAETISAAIVTQGSLGARQVPQIRAQGIDQVAQLLLQESSHFHFLNEVLRSVHILQETQKRPHVIEQIHQVTQYVDAQEAISRSLNPTTSIFEARMWVRENALGSSNFYHTPFYDEMIAAISETAESAVSVAGVIAYGPPGTGKTQMLIEANAREGYETTVIPMSFYTTMEELIAARALHVTGAGQARSVGEQIAELRASYRTPGAFSQDLTQVYQDLLKEGKLAKTTTLPEFLATIVTGAVRGDLLQHRGDIDAELWARVQDGFFQQKRTEQLRQALGPSFEQAVDDVVKGEILEAISQGKRAVLDEVEKAGPHALSGLLYLLSLRPGGDTAIDYPGGRTMIPQWFRIDATANDIADMQDALLDRFRRIHVSTPPIKDQLMIFSVLATDREGGLLLNSREQAQLVNFFGLVVPQINAILEARHRKNPEDNPNDFALSIRFLQALASKLVNTQTRERTPVSFGNAVRRTIAEVEGSWSDQSRTEIRALLSEFQQLFQEPEMELDIIESPGQIRERYEANNMYDQQDLAEVQDEDAVLALMAQIREARMTKINPERAKLALRYPDADITQLSTEEDDLRAEALYRIKQQPLLDQIPQAHQQIRAGIQRDIADSPLLQAIAMIPNQPNSHVRSSVRAISLTAEQAAAARKWVDTSPTRTLSLPTGMMISLEPSTGTFTLSEESGQAALEITYQNSGLAHASLALRGASADGRFALISSTINGKTVVRRVELFGQQEASDTLGEYDTVADAQMDQHGRFTGILANTGRLILHDGKTELQTDFAYVDRFAIAPNGRFLLVESGDQMEVYDLTQHMTLITRVNSPHSQQHAWHFIGEDVAVEVRGDQVQQDRALISH